MYPRPARLQRRSPLFLVHGDNYIRAGSNQRLIKLNTPQPTRLQPRRPALLVYDVDISAGFDQILTLQSSKLPSWLASSNGVLPCSSIIGAPGKHLCANNLDTRLQPSHTLADRPSEPFCQYRHTKGLGTSWVPSKPEASLHSPGPAKVLIGKDSPRSSHLDIMVRFGSLA